MIPRHTLFVVAGRHQEFESWKRENKCSVTLKPVYVSTPECLMGIENPLVIYYGTFTERSDIGIIYSVVHSRTR